MNNPFRKIISAGCLVFSLFLGLLCAAGCSGDPEHRAAYKQFLKEVLPLQAHQALPALSAEQSASFGRYARSYEVLRDFSLQMQESVAACGKYMSAISENVFVPKDIMEHAQEISAARDFIAGQPPLWEECLAALEQARTGFELHEDVAPLYDLLYNKYTGPARQAVPLLHAMQDFLDSNLELARYLGDNADRLEFQGNTIIFSDEQVQAEANAIMANLNARARELYWQENELNAWMLSCN